MNRAMAHKSNELQVLQDYLARLQGGEVIASEGVISEGHEDRILWLHELEACFSHDHHSLEVVAFLFERPGDGEGGAVKAIFGDSGWW